MKIIKITLCIGVLIILTACSTRNTEPSDTKEWYEYALVIPIADFLAPQSFAEIQKNSAAIVIAKTSESLADRQATALHDETGHVEMFYTDTTIEIIDILEQRDDSKLTEGDKVSYREYYALIKDEEREYILVYDNYTLLKKGSEYILVMAKSEEDKELYYNEAWNLAKFNIDGTDPYDFLFNPQQSKSLSSRLTQSLNAIQQIDKIQQAFSSYATKKDGSSAYSLNQLFLDKMRFYQELEERYRTTSK